MIFLDHSNMYFLRQEGTALFFVPQTAALEGEDWFPFTIWDIESDPSPAALQALFDSHIRCQAPLERIPAHLQEVG